MTETELERAERHLREGEARIAHQTALRDELARDGHDTTDAEKVLRTMLHTLALMREHLRIAQDKAQD